MPKRTLGSLGTMVRKKRGDAKLREVAKEIGIGPATLMRVENGRVPDVTTFGKICHWLKVDPGSFLGYEPGGPDRQPTGDIQPALISVAAHLRADKTSQQKTVEALAKMIILAASAQRATEDTSEDGGDS
jgi:transcriptional regulator with XRE-family HTH domain